MELKLSLFVPSHNPATRLLESLAGSLARRSQGRLTLRLFPREALGPTPAQFDLAHSGVADLAYMMHGATPGRFPLTELAALPFVGSDPLVGTAGLMAALPEWLAAEHPGVEVLFLVANAPMAVHTVMPLRGVADLAGKRIRHAGSAVAATLAAMGAIPVDVMPLDVRDALRDGRIDGAAMTYEGALINRLAGVVSHSFELDANTVTFGLVMNAGRYAELALDERSVLADVLGPAAGRELARMLAAAAAEGRRYMAAEGVTIVTPSEVDREMIVARLGAVTRSTVDALERRGLPAAAVLAALRSGGGMLHADR